MTFLVIDHFSMTFLLGTKGGQTLFAQPLLHPNLLGPTRFYSHYNGVFRRPRGPNSIAKTEGGPLPDKLHLDPPLDKWSWDWNEIKAERAEEKVDDLP